MTDMADDRRNRAARLIRGLLLFACAFLFGIVLSRATDGSQGAFVEAERRPDPALCCDGAVLAVLPLA